jgi:histidinol dehydrogenase
MAAAEIAGIDVVYKIGGVQAIGALAYGTKSIPAVDKIVGTGDRFMNIAGRMVFGYCSVDMMSGPGELCILCDGSTPAKYVAADLLAFAENDENALPLVITTNASYASRVDGEVRLQLSRLKRKETANLVVQKRALIVLARSTKEALDLVNETASQNLVLAVKDPDSLVDKIENAGAIHVGPYSAPGLIHFGAGSPNVLPTQGSSRYFSALTVNSFMKASTMHWVEPNALKKMSGPVLTLAQSEGLEAHAQAISARVEK